MRLPNFVREFVKLWENQLNIDWQSENMFQSLSEEGPHLSLLPEEYLTSLDKYLLLLRSQIEKVQGIPILLLLAV